MSLSHETYCHERVDGATTVRVPVCLPTPRETVVIAQFLLRTRLGRCIHIGPVLGSIPLFLKLLD